MDLVSGVVKRGMRCGFQRIAFQVIDCELVLGVGLEATDGDYYHEANELTVVEDVEMKVIELRTERMVEQMHAE